jgi:hypothetical protein
VLLDLRSLLESSGESNISGAVLEGSDSALGNVELAITLSGAILEGSDVVAGTLAAVHSISGAVTEGSDVVAGTLDLLIEISGAIQEGSDSFAGTLDVEDVASLVEEIVQRGGTGGKGRFKHRKRSHWGDEEPLEIPYVEPRPVLTRDPFSSKDDELKRLVKIEYEASEKRKKQLMAALAVVLIDE